MATMRDDRTHPLLAQVPLTVSPFVSLPTAATLPYTYKSMPSTLPQPSSGVTGAHLPPTTTSSPNSSTPDAHKPRYVIAASGHAAHPDDIVSSCRALQAHLARTQTESERALRELEDHVHARELAEKRRVAPGWLDSEARLLQPERRPGAAAEADADAETEGLVSGQFAEMSILDRMGGGVGGVGGGTPISEMAVDQGEELDRAFGGWK